jgi:uncharacterized protein with ATP-grasp and redox domains
MQSNLECFSCFLDHGLDVARRAGLDEEAQREVLNEVARMLPGFELSTRPPAMSLAIHRAIHRLTEIRDPFEDEKRLSNELALGNAPLIRSRIGASADPLKAAVEYAIAGNSLDFGAFRDLDIADAIDRLVAGEEHRITREDSSVFRLEDFRRDAEKSRTLLFITDNAGEIVMDMILMETLFAINPGLDITAAVRNSPIINDATAEDASSIGLDSLVRVISSGSNAPGTPLDHCSPEFLERFRQADMVIAKGQGNYETLSESPREVYLLFKVKCPVVARDSGGRMGDVMLVTSKAEPDSC